MQPSDFEAIEAVLHMEIAQRTKLGGYSPDAGTILFLCQAVLQLTEHVREQLPKPKGKKRNDKP